VTSAGQSSSAYEIRAASEADRVPLARLLEAVAEERDGIATEPPVDVEARAASFNLDGSFVADVRGEVVGSIHVEAGWFGTGEIGMMVAREYRGRGVGRALLVAAVDWASARGLHKVSLGVFPHNVPALTLYRAFGFVEEGRRVKHIRRRSGELWDVIEMGLLL
jgi:RimJ/RimL family protein N-acetyltransferase